MFCQKELLFNSKLENNIIIIKFLLVEVVVCSSAGRPYRKNYFNDDKLYSDFKA